MFITFGRSLYEVYHHLGPGYFDSLSGIVFFMLLGRYLQDKTYQRIAFDRDYTSYFPLSASVWKEGTTVSVPLSEIQKGDELLIHNQELIPVDARLAYGDAQIDYSFETGESRRGWGLGLFNEFAFESHSAEARNFTIDIMIAFNQTNIGYFGAHFDAF
jgi:Cu+-exporting ATPase